MTDHVCIVGAGILGLAHAWSAAERGWRVTVVERSARAEGASVRNFGMVWPIGQPAGDAHQTALASAERWRRLNEESPVVVDRCGSMHVAYREGEEAVLAEFQERAGELGFDTELLKPDEVLARAPGVRRGGLRCGLASASELGVDPPAAVRGLARWLQDAHDVEFRFESVVVEVEPGRCRLADGSRIDATRVIVCCGADLVSLFPEVLRSAPLRTCKLRMLRTEPQREGWHLGAHVASGLTLRHYPTFEVCPSLSALKARIAAETPELDELGIHVMASQPGGSGGVILGDSHEYGAFDVFDASEVERLILRELRGILDLPTWEIAARWHGVYVKCTEGPQFEAEPLEGVHLRTGLGGAGMTMSFGLAELDWKRWS